MSPKILVVGCGITGAAVNRYITSMFPSLKPSYTFWEKGSSLGGRMYTNYQSSSSDALFKKAKELDYITPHCDMGAQYLTRSSVDAEALIYTLLTDAAVITPIVDNTIIDGMRPEHLIKTHFVAPHGLSSVIDFLSQGDNEKKTEFNYNTILESINVEFCEEKKRTVYSAVGRKSDQPVSEFFDTIILTVPAPQLLEIKGDVVDMFGNTFRSQLSTVRYSSRYNIYYCNCNHCNIYYYGTDYCTMYYYNIFYYDIYHYFLLWLQQSLSF